VSQSHTVLHSSISLAMMSENEYVPWHRTMGYLGVRTGSNSAGCTSNWCKVSGGLGLACSFTGLDLGLSIFFLFPPFGSGDGVPSSRGCGLSSGWTGENKLRLGQDQLPGDHLGSSKVAKTKNQYYIQTFYGLCRNAHCNITLG